MSRRETEIRIYETCIFLRSTIWDEVAIKAALIQNAKVPCKSACLPFKSSEDLKNFDRLSNEVYADVVSKNMHIQCNNWNIIFLFFVCVQYTVKYRIILQKFFNSININDYNKMIIT